MYRKNVSGQFLHFQGVDAATGGIKSGVTWTVRRCIDGTFASATGTVTEDGSTGWYKFALSQADTNGNNIGFNFTGTGAIPQTVNILTTAADPTDAVRLGLTALPNANAEAAGGLFTKGTGAGQINQAANGQIDVNTVKLGGTTQTGRDIGASVLLSAGTGAGQLDFTSGVVKANLAQILGTALTETAGQIAAAFKKFFDKASPTGTINSLPDAVPSASGGLLIDDVWTDARAAKLDNLDTTISSRGTGTALDAAGVRSAVGLASANLDTQLSGLPAAVWDKLTSALTTVNSIGKLLVDRIDATISSRSTYAGTDTSGTTTLLSRLTSTRAGNLDNLDAAISSRSSHSVADVWNALTSGMSTAGSIGKRIIDFLTGDAYARLGAPAGASVSADIATAKSDTGAIKAKTDNLPASPAATGDIPTVAEIVTGMFLEDSGQVYADAIDGSVVKEIAVNAGGGTPPTVGEIADAVWDESATAHQSGGTTGALLNVASYIVGYRDTVSGNIVRFTGGQIGSGFQGDSVVVPTSVSVNYDNQYQGWLFVIVDTDSGIVFSASILSSDAGDGSLTLSQAIPEAGAIDPIPFLMLPAGMGDASRALLLYEGN